MHGASLFLQKLIVFLTPELDPQQILGSRVCTSSFTAAKVSIYHFKILNEVKSKGERKLYAKGAVRLARQTFSTL